MDSLRRRPSARAITLSEDLALPLSIVTESIGILAKRRAGKSTLARQLAEQLHHAGQQVVVADPKGDWWGLRYARDGNSPGLPFIVLGGEHGDVDLEVTGGELVARLVVEHRASVILDLSRFRKGEVCRFMTAFMESLYRLKAQERHRTPMMLIIDEADAIAPQKPYADEARMVGAASDLVRRGGQRGIGVTMLTQRSAVLNKDVLTQIGILVVLQTIAPQDRKAIDAWIDVHGTPEQRTELMHSLPTLKRGEGWVWAPGLSDGGELFQRAQFMLPMTFDSSRTPDGRTAAAPSNAAKVDLEGFREEMAATIEKARADDPKALRARIAELERQLKTVPAPVVEVEVIKDAMVMRLERASNDLFSQAKMFEDEMQGLADTVRAAADAIASELDKRRPKNTFTTPAVVAKALTGETRVPLPNRSGLPKPQQRILDALAWLESIGNGEPETAAVALLARYAPSSGSFKNPRAMLRHAGHIEYLSGDKLRLSSTGRELARFPERPGTTTELHGRIYDRLGGPERRILDPLLQAWPKSLSNAEVASRANYSMGSGSFKNPRARLRSLGLIEYLNDGGLRARDILFVDGKR